MEIYVVRSGDTVESIARAFSVEPQTIIYQNQLPYPYRLAVGQALLAGSVPDRGRAVLTNGYAYPYISPWVLRQTLPYLSRISVFSYGFTADGSLLFPQTDDSFILEAAREENTQSVLTLTPLDENDVFNNNRITQLVQNGNAVSNLLNELLSVMQTKGFDGLDIDFEYIRREDRDAFTEFVRRCADFLHPYGYFVTVALAPKTSASQSGLLYEGKDYRALGEAADSVLLMTYEWGYKYGPNMAVAPLNRVRDVVRYAVTEIAPEKINLGIPNYGYDWPLPFVRGETEAVTIGNIEAVQIAVRNNAEIEFDQTAQSPYFRYTENGIAHEVWFEDVRSLQAKYALLDEYGLEGIGVWQLMRWYRAGWLILRNACQIRKS